MNRLSWFLFMFRVINALHKVPLNSPRFSDYKRLQLSSQQSTCNAPSDFDLESFLKNRKSEEKCWRPTVQDVERISFGLPAKVKGTGSRGVPHRLNEEERTLYDMARRKGFLEVAGSGWRSQRRDAPLLNTYRSLCDARGQVNIVLHKGSISSSTSEIQDSVVIDFSTLRISKNSLQEISAALIHEVNLDGGIVVGAGISEYDSLIEDDNDTTIIMNDPQPWLTRPIYQLSPFCVKWDLSRPDAKSLGKQLASLFQTAEDNKPPGSKSKKPLGVKPGKSRRHGGYGIG
jgi:hypothetical protein